MYFSYSKHVFIHWFNRTEGYRTIRKRTWRYLSSFLSRYLPGSKPPPQNSAEAKKLGGGSTVRKSPIDES
ncbi:hypothetical protein BHL25_19695 [Bacillus cereus]|nr:hypothetical protein BHL25_19695 [Bacillus cereus]